MHATPTDERLFEIVQDPANPLQYYIGINVLSGTLTAMQQGSFYVGSYSGAPQDNILYSGGVPFTSLQSEAGSWQLVVGTFAYPSLAAELYVNGALQSTGVLLAAVPQVCALSRARHARPLAASPSATALPVVSVHARGVSFAVVCLIGFPTTGVAFPQSLMTGYIGKSASDANAPYFNGACSMQRHRMLDDGRGECRAAVRRRGNQ